MVANLSSHKRGWDDRWEEFSAYAEEGMVIQTKMLQLVDEDTNAFNRIMEAFGLPKESDEEKAERKKAIEEATKYAIEIPYSVMETAFESMNIIKKMVEIGNPNSVTDAAVGGLCARTAIMGAFLNVKINASGLDDAAYVKSYMDKATAIVEKANKLEKEILEITEAKI